MLDNSTNGPTPAVVLVPGAHQMKPLLPTFMMETIAVAGLQPGLPDVFGYEHGLVEPGTG